ncbi:stage V sporulation protein T [Alkalibaculum sp. M08DMB]|uniref:Stage V sporulation protein T n=1 Tax=Alkalibaculum sporogenes TaxID=2655001 RepID=A0A6A7K6B9_9FIRM|nr:stage V sporulation protein T [Alkalibaculum sporogenes]MPW24970.1 stage V sporulation protein T [Alkalibaculum sporogenes]
MKATGIVRRIDDLGRIVIPKEIRRTLRIREGDPLEIYTDKQGEVILKKYSPIGELGNFAQEYTDSIFQSTKFISFICDRDSVIAVSGLPKKDIINKKISPQVEKLIEERKTVISDGTTGKQYSVLSEGKEDEFVAQLISPIMSQGDPIGALFLLTDDKSVKMGEAEMRIAETGATFLGKQMEQ